MMSLQLSNLSAILHVPDTYELAWWILGCVCWFGFIIEHRLKRIQKQLAEMTAPRG
jgi:hypothetical protein